MLQVNLHFKSYAVLQRQYFTASALFAFVTNAVFKKKRKKAGHERFVHSLNTSKISLQVLLN